MRVHEIQDATGSIVNFANVGLLQHWCNGAPATTAGVFSTGCIAHRMDGGAGTSLYVNEGTPAAPTWVAVGTLGTGTFTGTVVSTAFTLSGGAATFTLKAATASAAKFTDGTTNMLDIDTRTTTSGAGGVTVKGQPMTLASAGSDLLASSLTTAAKTVTLTGGTTTTSLFGVMAYFGIGTITDASACTLSAASTIHIAQLAAAGGSLTITASYMVSTDVSDCFLTRAGVWTDHSSGRAGKESLEKATGNQISEVLDQVQIRTWHYREDVHGHDFNRTRVGIVADELPDALCTPGHEKGKGIAAGVLASFSIAALKDLHERLKKLEGTQTPAPSPAPTEAKAA